MKKFAIFFIVLIVFCVSETSMADEILFKNGERLIGTAVRMENAKVVFKSQLAGEVEVDLAQVQSLTTKSVMNLHLSDGSIVKSSEIKANETGLTVKGSGVESIPLSNIKAINPSIDPNIVWKGNITAGFNTTNGNTYNEQSNISINAVRRSKKTRLRFDGIYLVARDEDSDTGDKRTTEENFTIKSKYDYFFSSKIFSYLSGSFKKDHIADLDYRTIYGSGLGYQWIEEERLKFSTDAGLALLKEKYTSKINGTSQVTRSDDLSLQFGYNYFWEPIQNTLVLSNLSYTPAIDDFSDYYLTFDAELRISFAKSFYTSFKYILDYDSEPGDDSGSTDTKYIIGLGWDFY